jgi:hypothetical protein
VVRAWTLVLAAVVLGPALRPGYVLTYDMVFVPEPSFSESTFGLGSALPRAVPQDALVTALTTFVPGDLLQKVVLLAALVAAGLGAAALVPAAWAPGRLVAATVAVWNPYVAERLVLGHWGLLVAYAGLFWLVGATRSWRLGGSPWPVVALLGLTALTPTGGVLGLVAMAVVIVTTKRPAGGSPLGLWATAGAAVVVNAPWWVPGLLHGEAARSDEAGVSAFAARGELPGGVLPTLLGLGGVWNADVVPDSRETLLGLLWTALVLALAGIGVWRGTARGAGVLPTVLALGGVGLALALVGSLPVTKEALEWAVTAFPGAGLLRDGHKWVALAAPLLATAAAIGATDLARRMGTGLTRSAAVTGAALLTVALLPDLGWGVGGRLTPVDYPPAWVAVRDRLAAETAQPRLVVLPWSAFRAYDWNDDRTLLDPARRFFPGEVVTDDRLGVGDVTVPGEDPRAVAVARAIDRDDLDADWLADAGYTHVLVQSDQPGSTTAPQGTQRVLRRGDLDLRRVPGPVTAEDSLSPVRIALVALANLGAAALTLAAVVTGLSGHVRRRRDDRPRRGP